LKLYDYGWNEYFEKEWQQYAASVAVPGRVIADYGQKQRVVFENGETMAEWIGKRGMEEQKPVVGDWVALEYDCTGGSAIMRSVLTRKTKFSRAAAGREVREQVLAANVDIFFLMQSLNRDFNVRRMERYLIATWESGAIPVIVLTKADCCHDTAEKTALIVQAAPGVDIHVVSAVTGQGIDGLRLYFRHGNTIALLGSSGVGKSTLINVLAGQELLPTQEIRVNDHRGRHTTTHRELFLLQGGGLVMDTPGMRELLLWETETGITEVFGDVEELAASCRFADCSHGNEPGCAVREALAAGRLQQQRWESWQKLQKEFAYLKAKKDGQVRLREKQWGKHIAKMVKEIKNGD
jgi:ribosome biogenesis GTPase / thiamine phosphate phosphatase